MAIPIPIPTRLSPGACFARPGAIGSDPSRIPCGAEAWALFRHHWDKAITNGDEDVATPSHAGAVYSLQSIRRVRAPGLQKGALHEAYSVL